MPVAGLTALDGPQDGATLAAGKLVLLMNDYSIGARPIHLLSHPTAFRQKKISAFGQVMRAQLDRIGAH